MLYHTMKNKKINRKTEKKGKKQFRSVFSGKEEPGWEKTGKQRIKCPLFSEMQLLFSKNVVSFAMTFFFLTKKALNNERK